MTDERERPPVVHLLRPGSPTETWCGGGPEPKATVACAACSIAQDRHTLT